MWPLDGTAGGGRGGARGREMWGILEVTGNTQPHMSNTTQ